MRVVSDGSGAGETSS